MPREFLPSTTPTRSWRGASRRAVTVTDFAPVGDEDVARVRAELARCEAVVCCAGEPGSGGARSADLVAAARELGVPVYADVAEYLAATGSSRPLA